MSFYVRNVKKKRLRIMNKERGKVTFIMIIKRIGLWLLIFAAVFLPLAFIRIDIVIDDFTYFIASIAVFIIPFYLILIFLSMVIKIYRNWSNNKKGLEEIENLFQEDKKK